MTGTSRACLYYTRLSRELQEPALVSGSGPCCRCKNTGPCGPLTVYHKGGRNAMVACKKCKREIPEGALYCPWCGSPQKRNRKKKMYQRPDGLFE